MLRELMTMIRSSDAIAEMGSAFSDMLAEAEKLTRVAGRLFIEGGAADVDRESVSKQDVQLNKTERRIRRQIITHITLNENHADAPYCLLLMSLVKDVERIGDYCKNLVEVHPEGGGPVPSDELGEELRSIRVAVEATFARGRAAFDESDTETAREILAGGKQLTRRCDELVSRVARSEHDASTTTTLVLGARYYKRIQAHLLNILSGVVMPLHKLDYYDEAALPDADDAA
jgi:phosphate uptake regulator